MKKINIFNRNTNSPSYRRRGLPFPWERGPAEQPGGMGITPSCSQCSQSTPSWKEGEHKVPSFRGNAESPRCCRELVCGKTDGIPLFSGMTVRICGMMIAIAALFATPSFAEPTELDKKTVASKAYVDTKQDKITTGLVTLQDPEGPGFDEVASLLSYDTTSGLTGNKIGIYEGTTLDEVTRVLDFDSGEADYLRSFIPTVFDVALAVQRLRWDAGNYTSPISGYKTTFGNGTNNWAGNANDLITGQFLANSLALKQNKLGAKTSDAHAQAVTRSTAGSTSSAYITAGGSVGLTTRSGAPAVINYVNGTVATTEDMTTFTTGTFGTNNSTNQNYIKGALVSLELLKDVYSALHNEIQNATPTGTPGNVAMYDPSTGELGDGVATYDGSTTYNASTDAAKIAVMSGVQRKKECGGYEPAPAGQPAHDGTHPGDEDYCWLWIFPD